MTAPTVQTLETIAGGVTTPQGFAPPASARASRPRPARSISRCSSRTVRRRPPPSSRPTGAGGAGARLARSPRAVRRRGARDRRQQRLRERLHRRRRAAGRARAWPRPRRRCVGCAVEQVLVASTGVIGVALQIDKIRAGAAGGDRRARRRPGAAGRAGDHDDRSVPEGSGRARHHRRTRRHDRRHGQGLGHDRADDGDDARLRHHRCRGAAGRCSTARCARSSTTRSTPSPSTASARPTTA